MARAANPRAARTERTAPALPRASKANLALIATAQNTRTDMKRERHSGSMTESGVERHAGIVPIRTAPMPTRSVTKDVVKSRTVATRMGSSPARSINSMEAVVSSRSSGRARSRATIRRRVAARSGSRQYVWASCAGQLFISGHSR
jgi:hypothetical protein